MEKIVFTGGGTAGHIFPGLAIAEALSVNYEIIWLGSSNGRDRDFVSTLPRVRFVAIPSGKYRRYFSLLNFIDLFKIIFSFIVSFFILLKLKPVLLFSKGGFVSTPPCFASRILGIPVITHECDFSPGLATRLNARVAKKILVSYSETSNFFKKKDNVVYTGNPVRSMFYKADGKETNSFLGVIPQKPILLVLGGSLGSSQINNLIYENIEKLLEHFFVVHQTGTANITEAKNLLLELKENATYYRPFAFINEELPDLIYSSSIVVSRSGANTVWELATLGKPMVLIPLEQGSSRGDQVENAVFFARAEAAVVLQGENVGNFFDTVINLLNDEKRRKIMGENSKKLSNINVVKSIVDIVEELKKK
ncbi:MAG: undecaprenyldiphospho-muramoylpentapeptide beta-N-acetylglucosaminyltransferase [Treponema sp.]